MRSLLNSKIIKVPLQTREFNALNGSDAETFAASTLVAACRGEICWGSREEDNNKIDLIVSVGHPWYSGERMMLLCQVKSGDTYGVSVPKGFILKATAVKAAKRTSHPICILWVNRDLNKVYWSYIHPNSQASQREYGAHHEVSPATLFDLARCMSRNIPNTSGGRGIIIRRRTGDFSNRRKTVNRIYKEFGSIFSPVLGVIELTRLGWRHMFRASRSSKYKQSSIEVIPYLYRILHQLPNAHAVTDCKHWKISGFIYRATEHLLKYSEVQYSGKQFSERKNAEVIVKVIEEIRYPENWKEHAMISQCMDRRVVLKSAYSKIEC